MTTLKIQITVQQLEPGTHIMRKVLREVSQWVVELLEDDCQEIKPSWGVYRPTTTLPQIERVLRSRGLIPSCGPDERVMFGIASRGYATA